MTSSARASKVDGTSRSGGLETDGGPVFRGACTDKSAGFSPRRCDRHTKLNARRVRWPILLLASGRRTPRPWHSQDQPRHLLRLIQLDEVSRTRDQKEFGAREELMERPGDTAVQKRIGVAENDPDRASELFQLGNHLCARLDRGQ